MLGPSHQRKHWRVSILDWNGDGSSIAMPRAIRTIGSQCTRQQLSGRALWPRHIRRRWSCVVLEMWQRRIVHGDYCHSEDQWSEKKIALGRYREWLSCSLPSWRPTIISSCLTCFFLLTFPAVIGQKNMSKRELARRELTNTLNLTSITSAMTLLGLAPDYYPNMMEDQGSYQDYWLYSVQSWVKLQVFFCSSNAEDSAECAVRKWRETTCSIHRVRFRTLPVSGHIEISQWHSRVSDWMYRKSWRIGHWVRVYHTPSSVCYARNTRGKKMHSPLLYKDINVCV